MPAARSALVLTHESRERLAIDAESPESVRFDRVAAEQLVDLAFVEAGFRCDAGCHFRCVGEGGVGGGVVDFEACAESLECAKLRLPCLLSKWSVSWI
ncbi:MAG: hypothetical protein VX246_11705 [Myxococcota bacterium]|nr:hypothetical protein [Myxococcota bacterium]